MAEREDKGDLPAPKAYSGQFVQGIPKSIHRRLATRAAAEGVSLNPACRDLSCRGVGPRAVEPCGNA